MTPDRDEVHTSLLAFHQQPLEMKFNGRLPWKTKDLEPMPLHLDPSGHPLPSSTGRTRWRMALAALLVFVSYKAFSTPSAAAATLHMDKFLHVCAFICLAFAATRCWAPGRQKAWGVALGLALYGAFIELVQSQLPSREASVADWAADALGIALGLALAHRVRGIATKLGG